jgi:hypothetical protein
MDKKTKKLLKKFDLSVEDLSNQKTSIYVDVTSMRDIILPLVNTTDIIVSESEESNMSGKEIISLGGSIISIIDFLSRFENTFGTNATVGISIGVGVAIASSVIFLTIPEAREIILKKIKKTNK